MTRASHVTDLPRTAIRLLWLTGIGLDALAIVALLGDSDPEGAGSRIVGAIVIGAVGAASLVAALMARSRPTLAFRLGLAAAAGMLFIAWLVLTRPTSSLFTILVGMCLLIIGGVVAWQLVRWRRASSGEAEDGANLP